MAQTKEICRFDKDIKSVIVSESVLAQTLQLSQSSIKQHRHKGMPSLLSENNKSYEYDILACVKWLQINLDHSQSKRNGKQADILNIKDIIDKDDADIELKKARLEKLKLENAILERKYIKVDDVDRVLANLAAKFVGTLRNFIKVLPPKLKSKTESQLAKILQSVFSQEITDIKTFVEQEGLFEEIMA